MTGWMTFVVAVVAVLSPVVIAFINRVKLRYEVVDKADAKIYVLGKYKGTIKTWRFREGVYVDYSE